MSRVTAKTFTHVQQPGSGVEQNVRAREPLKRSRVAEASVLEDARFVEMNESAVVVGHQIFFIGWEHVGFGRVERLLLTCCALHCDASTALQTTLSAVYMHTCGLCLACDAIGCAYSNSGKSTRFAAR